MASAEETHIEHVEGRDHAKLVVQRDGETITVEGDPEEVQRQFEQHYAEAVNTTPEELAEAVEEYPVSEPTLLSPSAPSRQIRRISRPRDEAYFSVVGGSAPSRPTAQPPT